MDNLSLFFLIFGLSNQSDLLDSLLIFGAEFVIYLALTLIVLLTIKASAKERKALIVALISLPIVIILIKIIHLLIFEPRPFVAYQLIPLISHSEDASFPSRHTSIMAAIAFAYLYVKSKWSPLFLLLLFWVGISRIFVGVHYPLDILGGVAVGLLSVVISVFVAKKLKTHLFTI